MVTLTATSAGCGTPEYEFWKLPPGGSWTIIGAYPATNPFAWDTTGLAPGPYQVGVWARQTGSTNSYDSYAIITFWVT
jgi:hypothetical protein